ncbi:unnamed protein product [Brachionus calyciflorus]|uniref:5'-3' exoribonuclease n=1 Tax=Brachionus calyciflorus TaxID=104777 RepID=A0A813WPK8_9BILA|nr:unnamed protein product [Brachionus calyciflorus]
MGVPAFFRWLTKKYPSIVVQCVEEKSRVDPTTNEKIPPDTSQPNPNDIEFDNLYLDMNGIIHPCTHPEDRPAPKTEDEMMTIIFEFIDRIFAIVRPRKVLYMAIDGVAPRAKMNQQRSRRFRAAKESCEKASEIKRLKEQIMANGGVVPPDVPQSEKFDSNCITPGTPFMHRLAECLRYYIHDRLNNDPGWKNISVILSDANVPGEGEHKIMDYIRRQRANPDHDPNTHHVLCGADADLIMLGLATHEPNFTIIREEFRPDRPRPCEICSQFGHETKECSGMAREKQGQYDELANTFTPSEQKYIFLRLNILREYLSKELNIPNLPFEFNIERVIDDWVFMCFFVGNDFLPHLPSLEIREGAIDRLVNLYKAMISKSDGYLTDSGDVNLQRAQLILSGIGEVEDDIFKKRQQNELNFRHRQKDRKRQQKEQRERARVGYDLPIQMPEWMKSGPFAPTPLGGPSKIVEITPVDNDEEKRGVKRKTEGEEVDEQDVAKKAIIEEKAEEEEDEDANDQVRLWEDGWKHRYYKVKFDVEESDVDFRQKVAHHYAIGLQWVLKYYYQGVPSWNWYFPYHYAPFASDFIEIELAEADFSVKTEPFKPFEQLMAVFPAASKKHIPEPWHSLMTDEDSAIIDFYPEDFQIDLNGKKASWQGVALLPFVDEDRLKKTLEMYHDKLSEDEKKRNKRDNDRFFVGKHHKLYELFKQMYSEAGTCGKKYKNFKHSIDMDTSLSGGIAGKIWYDEYVCSEGETYRSPIRFICPDIPNNHVLSVHYHDPVYDSEYVFKTNILEGAVMPEATLRPEDFHQQNYRPRYGFNNQSRDNYRQNRTGVVANRMIQNSIGGNADGDQQIPSLMSSAHGGNESVYGSYKSSSTYTERQSGNYTSSYQQNRQQSNYSYNYNNRGQGYNQNQQGGYDRRNQNNNNYNQRGGHQQGGYGQNYNNNYNNQQQRGGYNNRQGGGGGGGYNQNYNQNSRFNNEGDESNGRSNNQQQQSQQQNYRQYNRQNTR